MSGFKPPWAFFVDDGWRIVGMNHYMLGKDLHLFVAMTRDGACIHEEGKDDEYLWNRLTHKVWALNAPVGERRVYSGGMD